MKTNKSRFIANPTKSALNKVLDAGLNELSKIGLIASSDDIKGEWVVTLPSLVKCEDPNGSHSYEWMAVEYVVSNWDEYQMLSRMADKLCDELDMMN